MTGKSCFDTIRLKQIQKLYKTPYIDEWHDRAITLYVDHNVRFGGEIVDGIRIRNTIPKVKVPTQKKYKCADCGAEITGTGGKSVGNVYGVKEWISYPNLVAI